MKYQTNICHVLGIGLTVLLLVLAATMSATGAPPLQGVLPSVACADSTAIVIR